MSHTSSLIRVIVSSATVVTFASLAGAAVSVTGGPAAQNGYPHTTTSPITLSGLATAAGTSSVKVNGVSASWTPATSTWSAAGVVLPPGVNRVLIQALDSTGAEIERLGYDIWYDDGSVQNVSGAISGITTWTAAGGPYNVTAALSVPSGATLTIQPGTCVYLASGVGITVASGGTLNAPGTETKPVRFTRAPAVSTTWTGLTVNGTANISYAHFQYNGNAAIHSSGGTVTLDRLTFGATNVQYIVIDSSSFVISRCIFPTPTAGFEMVHGTGGIKSGGVGIIRDSIFGIPTGYNDTVDFTGGNRPGPIVQFLGNVFTGATDDELDLDGTDAWVEGNIFLHVHRNGAPDSSSGVSGGKTGSDVSHITIIGNLFFDIDQAATAKEANFYTLINNTIVNQNHNGSQDSVTGVINLDDTGFPVGAGMYLEGNIVYDAELLARNYVASSSTVTFNNNLLPMAWSGPGTGNTIADPQFVHVPTVAETNFTSWEAAQVMWTWLGLQTGSPGRGTGPNGRDKGGVIPYGASISGEPSSPTSQTTATLTVGTLMTGNGIPNTAAAFPNGSGFTHYKWRLDGGAWSAETPIATPISLSGLGAGSHRVDVVGKNDALFYQDDARFGQDAVVTHSKTWIVSSNNDTDGDGIPDSWETANGLNPNDPTDALIDTDGDGQINRDEFLAGTDPRDSSSVLRASLAVAGSSWSIEFVAVAGKTYSVQYKTSLDDPAWLKLADVPAQTATSPFSVADALASGQDRRFYRVVTPAQP